MTRYHPFVVALHWLVALMIFMALVVGGPGLEDMANDNPDKVNALAGHMIFGLVIGVLMIIRLITRRRTQAPPKADAGNALLNMGAQWAHIGLYVLVLAMVGSGIAISVSAGLAEIVFMGSGDPLPADFEVFLARGIHELIAFALFALIIAHILGWGYHQFVLKDGLIRRMGFGKRK